MNSAQEQYLAYRGAKSVNDMDVMDRLQWANLSDVPDPAKEEPDYSLAAREWLGGRDPAALSPESRAQFEWLNNDPIFRQSMEVRKVATVPTEIDPALVASLPPERRLDIENAKATALAGRAERRENCDPRMYRVSDRELEWAEMLTRSYWKAA